MRSAGLTSKIYSMKTEDYFNEGTPFESMKPVMSKSAVGGCRILHLTLSKMPFEVMVTGEKSTEYREPSKWILSRLQGKKYDLIKFVNGYGSDKPYFIAKFRGWEIETNPYSVDFSNGLKVTTKKGTVKIYAGEIVERGNLNGCHRSKYCRWRGFQGTTKPPQHKV